MLKLGAVMMEACKDVAHTKAPSAKSISRISIPPLVISAVTTVTEEECQRRKDSSVQMPTLANKKVRGDTRLPGGIVTSR